MIYDSLEFLYCILSIIKQNTLYFFSNNLKTKIKLKPIKQLQTRRIRKLYQTIDQVSNDISTDIVVTERKTGRN